jgi:hypothetical protein
MLPFCVLLVLLLFCCFFLPTFHFYAMLVLVGVPLLMLVNALLLCSIGAHWHPLATLYWYSSLPPCYVLVVLVSTSLLYSIVVHHHLFILLLLVGASLLCSIGAC